MNTDKHPAKRGQIQMTIVLAGPYCAGPSGSTVPVDIRNMTF